MSDMPNIDIRPDHWEIVRDILRKHVPQYEVWAFGSRAKWTAKTYSDLDLAVITDKPLPIQISANLSEAFSESDLPWKVDVVDWATTSESFRSVINRDKIVLQSAKNTSAGLVEMTLREAGVSLIDCDHRTPPAAISGYPYIAIPQLREGRIDLSDVRLISAEDLAEWTRKAKPRQHDVILSRRCNPGETAYVPEGLECALGQNLVLLRADGNVIYPPFLRWLVQGDGWWGQVGKHINVGAVFESLKCADIPNFKLSIPPLEEQRKIAYVLGALDEKIECNGRTIKALSGIAKSLFKNWFVDFEPSVARRDGREVVGIFRDQERLFPDSLYESSLGPIPAGWSVGSILRQAELLSGGTPKTDVSAYWDGDIPWVSARDVSRAIQPFLTDTERKITNLGVERSSTKLIPALSTVVISRGATTGRVALLGREMAMNQTCYGLHSKVGTPFSLYCNIQNFIDRLVLAGHGSIFDTITTSTFKATEVVLPPVEVQLEFERIVSPVFQEILARQAESSNLASIRDSLLPKLLTGQVLELARVSE